MRDFRGAFAVHPGQQIAVCGIRSEVQATQTRIEGTRRILPEDKWMGGSDREFIEHRKAAARDIIHRSGRLPDERERDQVWRDGLGEGDELC